MCFIWNEQVFIRFLFFLTQEGLHITGSKRLAFFWNRGLYVLELIPYAGENERFLLRCFLRYIEIIPEKNIQFRSLIQNFNFSFFLCLKC